MKKRTLCLLLLITLILNLTSCKSPTKNTISKTQVEKDKQYVIGSQIDLMKELKANAVPGKELDAKFINNTSNFSIELFKRSFSNDKNSLISPLSVLLALSMSANGADKETLVQMEKVLGNDISLDELNQFLYSYAKNLPSKEKSKLNIVNSIWFRDDEQRLIVEKDFLQKNADFYNAAAYKSKFDDDTLKDINNWVKYYTDDMIEKILDKISDDAIMYLINAIVFDAEWETIYRENQISDSKFTNFDGSKVTISMMQSEETMFLKDKNATGFIKPYAHGDYSFVALLPDEKISITDYVNSLTGESFQSILNNAEAVGVLANSPKFSYDYTVKMNDALIDMGMNDAFSSSLADFNKLGKSSRGNIFIFEVLHKTFISFDEKGTKAGAVTKVEVQDESEFGGEIVTLNRPFVYSIIDNKTNLPIFIGVVMDLSK